MADIVKLIQQQPDLCSMKGASYEDIESAEHELKLKFATDYRKYIATFGAVSFGSHELTGVCSSKRLSVVNTTIHERNNTAIPNDWYVLEQTNFDGIVIWQASDGMIYETMPNAKARKLCDSLAEYVVR